MSVIAGWQRRVRGILTREMAGRHWDALLWGCGAVGLVGIILSWFVPAVSELAVLFSVTLFANGPYGALLPAVQEPIVMVFARLYPAWLVALVATVSATAVEYVNYRLFEAAVHSRVLTRARQSKQMQLVVRWFAVQPLLTVAFCALTPIPFVLARIVAVAARYSPTRFLVGNALGRFPRFWAYGTAGVLLPVSTGALLVGGAALTVLLGIALWARRTRYPTGTAASLPG